jgi:lipopolysaccharide export system permease protein
MLSTILPSKTLGWYMAKMFLVRFLAFLLGLCLILQVLDLLNETDRILRGSPDTPGVLWQYVGWRLPQLISLFTPFAVLLATLLTFASLNQNSEITIMRAAGLSPHQILTPLFLATGVIALVHFAFNDSILMNANANLNAWKKIDYRPLPKTNDGGSQVWFKDGNRIISARDVKMVSGQVTMAQVTIYNRPNGISLASTITAPIATLRGGAIELARATETNLTNYEKTVRDLVRIPLEIPPQRFVAASVNADRTRFLELRTAISQLEEGGQATDTLKASLYHKISGPLSSILMPLLGAVAAFGVARSGKLFVRVVAGMFLGFAYFVADNFMMAMGQFGAAPPLLAAWAPFLLFLCVGEAVIYRTEE